MEYDSDKGSDEASNWGQYYNEGEPGPCPRKELTNFELFFIFGILGLGPIAILFYALKPWLDMK